MNPGTIVIGYARVSTVEQADSGNGIAAQEAAIRAECDRRGWTLAYIARDEGVSGKTLDRPALTEALERIAGGEAVGIVAAKLDRLSRSVVDFGRLLEWASEADATVVALDLGVDTSTASGRLVANVLASVAEWERGVTAERTRDALAARKSAGLPISRPAVSSDLAARIAAMRASGSTYQAIADTLNAEGVPTARGAAAWRVSSVQSAAGYQRRTRSRKSRDLPALPKRRRSRI